MNKYRLIFIPFLIVSVLLSCISFTAYADEFTVNSQAEGLPSYFYTKEELIDYGATNYSINGQQYLYTTFTAISRSGSDKHRYDYMSSLIFTDDSSTITYTEDNGVYTFTTTTYFYALNGYKQIYYGINSDYTDEHQKTIYFPSKQDIKIGNQLVVDTTDSSIYYGTNSTSYMTGNIANVPLSLEFNFSDASYGSDGLNISVTFNPNLSGSVDRSTTHANGTVDYLDNFNFNVTNNGSKNVQWFMAIVEQGYQVGFDVVYSERGADRTIHSDSIRYIYLYNEEVYLDDSLNRYMTATVASTFHFTAAHDSSGIQLVKWEMVNLEKNHNYDVVVYAVSTDSDKVSFVDSSLQYNTNVGSPVDFGEVQEVYRSTFSVVNPAVYKSDSKIGGSTANDPNTDYTSKTGTLYSYTGLDGETHYGQFDYMKEWLGQGSDLDYVSGYGTSGGTSKFNSLISNTTGVFRFFGTVMGYFPGQLYTIFSVGFFALITIAIIKKVT